MKNTKVILFSCMLFVIQNVQCGFTNIHKRIKPLPLDVNDDPGLPLILTPFIEQNNLDEAKNYSKVNDPVFLGVESYSGYFTVDKTFDSNLFFWFFPAEVDYENAPVLLWLQGGPGSTSMFGLFTEIGPFQMETEQTVSLMEHYWSRTHSVLYIDNPAGTGFSFTSDGGYRSDETQVGEDLYVALQQFFAMFHELQNNDFYVTGESYAGKYIPAIAYTIHKKNPTAEFKINLKGVSIGDGLSDPINQLEYGDYFYQLGLVDQNGRNQFHVLENEIKTNYANGNYEDAFNSWDALINGDLTAYPTLCKNLTGFDDYYNYLHLVEDTGDEQKMNVFLQSTYTRKAIHVGNALFWSDPRVEESLRHDMIKSVAPWISELLSSYRVLTYNGQLDVIVAYPLTENYLKNLKFSGDTIYKTAERKQWRVNNELAGYVKTAGNLTEILVRNAGHMVPHDQPEWAFHLINTFTKNLPFA